MSTFDGLVEELPGISVDRFDGENLKSSAYFLSHCHTDHMAGLSNHFFADLERNKRFVYCTPLSKAFLEARYGLAESLSETVIPIEACSPVIVDYTSPDGNRRSVTVQCVPAGHCPGSVMFVFENPSVSVLYTGDFRITPSDIRKLKPLHYRAGDRMLPKKFDKIYLDTTFLDVDYREFPSRQRSLAEISRSAREWISRDPRNVVLLECSALYGSEFVYMELVDSLKKRVHVRDAVYQSYLRIPELERCITDDAASTPVHACVPKIFGRMGLKCRDNVRPENILTIVPSAVRWRGRDTSKCISEWDARDERRFCVCLSMHSSYNELRAFLDYFQPAAVRACVESRDSSKRVRDTLNEIMRRVDDNAREPESRDLSSFKLNNPKRARVQSKYFSDDSSD